MDIDGIFIYRITHIDNIRFILKNGITHKKSKSANSNYINIGDVTLIDTRAEKTIVVNNRFIVLGDYIPFYFGVRMPMLYVIQQGGNFVEKPTKPSKIVYVVCKLNDIIESGNEYIFSDGHAIDNFTVFYDSNEIENLVSIVDWDSVRATKWSGNNVPLDLKRKMQAEFLVKHDIKPDLIAGFVCYNESAREELLAMGIENKQIVIKPTAYY